jgi:hypothetical protein
VYTDAFAINWPPRSPARVIANGLLDPIYHIVERDPQQARREQIG